MKASKFSEAQIAFVLKQAEDGTAVGKVCRKAGISEAMFYNWRRRYAGRIPPAWAVEAQLFRSSATMRSIRSGVYSCSTRYCRMPPGQERTSSRNA